MSTPYARVNEDVGTQSPLLRVTTSPSARKFYQLQSGKPGSLQTAAIMASLVREAAVKDKALEIQAAQILVDNGLDSHSDPYDIADTLLRYVQKITYIHDPAGAFDSVQSARQVMQEGKGDCDDLSVLLATLLALVGFKPRFVLAKYKEETDGFDHVYVDLELPRGRVALDPTSRKHGIGWESPKFIERVAYPIFDGKVVGLGEIAGKVRGLLFRRTTDDGRRTEKRSAVYGRRSAFGFSGCGGSCGASSSTSVTAGDVSANTLGGARLSFPAVLFGLGFAFCALKVFDLAVKD